MCRRSRARSRSLRRSPRREGGILESGCASCRRRANRNRTRRPRSRPPPDRAPPSATPAPPRRRRPACRSDAPAPPAGEPRCSASGRPQLVSAGRSRPAAPRGVPAGRRARTGGRRCDRGCRERRSTSSLSDRRRYGRPGRSGGCIRGPACAPGMPTGSRRPYGNSRGWRCRSLALRNVLPPPVPHRRMPVGTLLLTPFSGRLFKKPA